MAALLAKAADLVKTQRGRVEKVARLLREPKDPIDLESEPTA
jgi:hypothetical protein